MIRQLQRCIRASLSGLLVFTLTATAAPPAVAQEGDLHLLQVIPATASVVFRQAGGVAFVPDGGVATYEQTVFVADPAAKSVTGIKGDGTVIGPWTAAGGESFVEPTDVAADLSGNIYVADKGRPYVYKIDAATGALVEKIGSGLIDAVGVDWMYVSGGGHQVFVADATGRIVRFADTADTTAGTSYSGGASLVAPLDVEVQAHPDGFRLWVTDAGANKVVCVNWNDSVLASWGESGTGTGQLSTPVGIAVRGDFGNDVVVSDAGGRIQRFTQAGVYQSTLASEGVEPGQVAQPQRMALDSANDWLWVAEKESGRAQLFNGLGESRRIVGGAIGGDPGAFNTPTSLVAGADGSLIVCDSGNNRVQRFDNTGALTLAFGAEGTADGEFRFPSGVAVDRDGNIYVSDTLNHRVQKFASNGDHLATWGSFGSGPAQFDQPKGIAVDSQGYVYVADSGNSRIRKLAPNGDPVAEWTSYLYKSANRNFYRLSDIAIGPEDHLYVYDGWNGPSASRWWVPELKPDGTVATVHFDNTGGGLDARWGGLYVSDSRTVYVAESDDAWDAKVHMRAWLPGFWEGGTAEYSNSGGGPGQLAVAGDVAVGPLGVMYVSDTALHRIQRFQIEDVTAPRTTFSEPDGWANGDSGILVQRPTDGLAGPLSTWMSVDGEPPHVIWSASEEATANPSRSMRVSEEGTHTFEFWAVDGFGNKETTNTAFARIDRYFPEATVTVSPSGWTTESVEVSIDAADSGAGIASVTYSTNGAAVTSQRAYTGPFAIDAEGVTNIPAQIADGAGKTIVRGGQAKIDRTAPVTSLFPFAVEGGLQLWPIIEGTGSEQYGTTSTWWRVDAEATPRLGAPYVFLGPGTHDVDYWSIDPAGNIESEQTTQVVVPDGSGGDPGGGDPTEGSFLVADGRNWFNSNDLPITSNVPDAQQMRFMVPGDADWREWMAYAEQTTLTADPAEPDGEWMVFAQYRFGTDEGDPVVDAEQAIGIDRIAPATGSNANEVRNFSYGEDIILVPEDDRSGVAEVWYRIGEEDPVQGETVITFGAGEHRLRWWSVDHAGNIEDEHDRTVTVVKTASDLSTTSRSATIVQGGTYYLTGRLSANAQALPAKSMRLQYLSGSSWRDTSVYATTDSNGYYKFALKPTSKAVYRATWSGDAGHEGASGSSVTVVCKPSVGNPIAPSRMYRNRTKTVYGYLKPRHTAGSYPVRIYKYRYVSGKWKSYGYVKAKASNYSSYTKYSGSVKLAYRGKWRLRAYAPADSGHPSAWSSGFDYVTVK